jgi:DNA invertase Pin-like site-specific DNA recombinase
MARTQAKAAGGAHRAPGSGGHRKRGQAAPGAQRCDTAAHGRRRGPARLLSYLRVSTRGQADNGISLEEQEARIRAYAEANGAELAAVEADRGLSGRTAKRPGLRRVLDRLRAGDADGVVVARLDRLSRSLRDAVNLFAKAEQEGWQIHSLNERLDTSSPSGRFVCHVLAAMAEWEREIAAERTRASATSSPRWRNGSAR